MLLLVFNKFAIFIVPIFKMTKFVKCEWGLKCNLYTPKCTYEHLKLKIFFGGHTPDPLCGRGDTPSPSTAFGRAWVAARPIVRTPNCTPHVPKRSDATDSGCHPRLYLIDFHCFIKEASIWDFAKSKYSLAYILLWKFCDDDVFSYD